jgi:branched-chain amino acid transport system permease protein
MSYFDRIPIDATITGLILFILSVLFLSSSLFIRPPSWSFFLLEVAVLFLLYILILVGLNLQFGHTGLTNFGPVAFFAIGGYSAALITAQDPYGAVGLGMSWPIGLVVGVAAAIGLGVLVGAATLRLRDDFLAIVTLAVAEIIHGLLMTFRDITGGSTGLQNVPQPVSEMTGGGGGAEIFANILVIGSLALFFYGVFHRLSTGPYGRVLRAIRADQLVTQTLGKRVFRYKFMVLIYGSAIAGLAGVLYVFYNGAVSPLFFTIDVTVTVWVGMLIGGVGSDRGVIGGLAIIMGFRLLTRFFNQQIPAISQDQFASIRLIMVGLLLMLIIKYRPEGIWGDPKKQGVES